MPRGQWAQRHCEHAVWAVWALCEPCADVLGVFNVAIVIASEQAARPQRRPPGLKVAQHGVACVQGVEVHPIEMAFRIHLSRVDRE